MQTCQEIRLRLLNRATGTVDIHLKREFEVVAQIALPLLEIANLGKANLELAELLFV
jgi:hypothetical protein